MNLRAFERRALRRRSSPGPLAFMGRSWIFFLIDGRDIDIFRALRPYWCEAFDVDPCTDGSAVIGCSFKGRDRCVRFLREIAPTVRRVTRRGRGTVRILRGEVPFQRLKPSLF